MANFEHIILKTLEYEGLYSNDSVDNGGETYKGVARKFHPNWAGWTVIDSYSKTDKKLLESNLARHGNLQKLVITFYKENFWDRLKLDEIDNDLICEKLFDIAVNQGSGTAGKYFQKVLNFLNNNEKYYNNIVVDGGIGANTLRAYNSFMKSADKFRYRTEEKNAEVIVKCLTGEQYARYRGIVERNEKQERFFYGWISNRI